MTWNGVGINTANVRTGILDVAGIATFRSNTLVGSGITLSPDGDVFTTGITTIGKRILGISTNNISSILISTITQIYHPHQHIMDAFAHVHVAGKAFYAHAGAWYSVSQCRIRSYSWSWN